MSLDAPPAPTFSVLLVAVGEAGASYARALARPPAGLRLTALHAPDGAAPEMEGVVLHDDLDAALATHPDLTVDTSPVHARLSITGALLRGGGRVLCVPPLAADAEGARRLIGLAARGAGTLAVAHALRFDPALRALGVARGPLRARVSLADPGSQAARLALLEACDAARVVLRAMAVSAAMEAPPGPGCTARFETAGDPFLLTMEPGDGTTAWTRGALRAATPPPDAATPLAHAARSLRDGTPAEASARETARSLAMVLAAARSVEAGGAPVPVRDLALSSDRGER